MECIGYDKDVQRRLIIGGTDTVASKNTTPKRTAKAPPTKRKRAPTNDEEDEEDCDISETPSRARRRLPGRTARKQVKYTEDSDSE